MALAVLDRSSAHTSQPEQLPVWRTCLREVVFSPDNAFDASKLPRGAFLLEEDAYRHVLEVICGLDSPMVGETQVLGQFKAFLSSLPKEHAWLRRVGQRLLTDAREIREHHLQGLGSRSYGSAVRRHVADCGRVAVIGTGALAAEVLPFVAEGRAVDQWGRKPRTDVAAVPGVTYRSLDELDGTNSSACPVALVVAAPVPKTLIARVAASYRSLVRVIDLRGEQDVDGALELGVDTVPLGGLFAEMQAARETADAHVQAAREEIARRSRLFACRDELRPFGWDDLCA